MRAMSYDYPHGKSTELHWTLTLGYCRMVNRGKITEVVTSLDNSYDDIDYRAH